jgi:hypothetical protein
MSSYESCGGHFDVTSHSLEENYFSDQSLRTVLTVPAFLSAEQCDKVSHKGVFTQNVLGLIRNCE